MRAEIILPVVAAVLVTLVIIWRWGSTVESAYETFDYFRRLIGAVIVVLLAGTFLRSGSTILFGIALLLIMFAVVWFYVEQPHRKAI